MPAPLLDIRDLSVEFVNNGLVTKALKDINISVRRGELLAIVGESGSGKSVTSLSILQLLPSPPAVYRSGSIELTIDTNTVDLLHASAAQLQSIRGNDVAMIFQEPMTSLNPVLTCGFQVMEAIKRHRKVSEKEAIARTIALFEKVKLPDPSALFARYPHQLSGGQKQRVMIAMAMSCDPALLICDEPTTALDVTVQKNILELIRELQAQNNMGVIFITHDLGVVAEIADRVAVMYRGEIVEQNSTAAIFQQPQHPYTKALLACRPALHPKGERLPVVSDFMQAEGKERFGQSATKGLQPEVELKPAPDLPPVLRVEHLKVYFPARKNLFGKVETYTKAVDDVSFEVYPGETLGLVGESGCGKSTLGRAILQLVGATGGEIRYKGIDLLKAPSKLLQSMRKDMQIIFQDPYSSLNPRITVGEAISEPLKVHGIISGRRARKEKVISLLEKVDLRPEHYDRYPHEFSGGQRQRIVIARALALEPSFVICDESVSALDVSVQAQVLNLLNDLKKEYGFTSIFISHDLSVVRYISDRIMVMNKGKIEETGSSEQVYRSPKSSYTMRLIESIPGGLASL
ncbi:MAG: ABC transporter ATP-binding protein [Chitinophagaceae bacterium]|nr:ABC transporter ATP-binding protein [Chitinophagaceae bacterium]